MYDSIIFDLDGTLLDTIEDIRNALNEAYFKAGYESNFSTSEVKSFIGSGPVELINRSMKNMGVLQGNFDKLFDLFKPLYKEHQQKNTHEFPGMREALDKIVLKGIKVYCVTNKPQALAEEILSKVFKDFKFDGIMGFKLNQPRKPSKEYAEIILKELNLKGQKVLYVGDSPVDLEFSKNAGFDCCLALYGYGNFDINQKNEANFKIFKPLDILNII